MKNANEQNFSNFVGGGLDKGGLDKGGLRQRVIQ